MKTLLILDTPPKVWTQREEYLILKNLLDAVNITDYEIYTILDEWTEAKNLDAKLLPVARQEIKQAVLASNPDKMIVLGQLGHAAILNSFKVESADKNNSLSLLLQFDGTEPIYTVLSIPVYYAGMNPDRFRDLQNNFDKLRKNKPFDFPAPNYTLAKNYTDLAYALSNFAADSKISIDIETAPVDLDSLETALEYNKGKIESIGFTDGQYSVIAAYPLFMEYDKELAKLLLQFLSSYQIVLHNAKFDLKFLLYYIRTSLEDNTISLLNWRIDDTILLSYVLDERGIQQKNTPHGLKTLSKRFFDLADYHFDFKTWFNTPIKERDWISYYNYLYTDIVATSKLEVILQQMVLAEDSDMYEYLYTGVLMPALKALTEIELTGAYIDKPKLVALETEYAEKIENLVSDLKDYLLDYVANDLANSFNPNSTKQVYEILYKWLKLPKVKESTDRDALEQLLDLDTKHNAFIEMLLEYRLLAKTYGTYIKGILERLTDADTVHTQINVNSTTTGRTSSENPNLQNIPRGLGKLIRSIFIAPENYVFVEADYSQLELRVAAYLAKDVVMRQTFLEDRDIHTEVAAAAFRIPLDQVSKEQRQIAKRLIFGSIYGMSPASIVHFPELKELGYTVAQAENLVNGFMSSFAGLNRYMQEARKMVSKKGFYQTPFYRKRRWLYINKQNKAMLGEFQRQCMNGPIQATASDFCLTALTRLHYWLIESGAKSRIAFTVHDSINMLVHKSELEEVCTRLQQEMLDVPLVDFDVPLKIDIKVGPNWGELTEWK